MKNVFLERVDRPKAFAYLKDEKLFKKIRTMS